MKLNFRNRIATWYLVATALLIAGLFSAIYLIVKDTVFNHLDSDLDIEIKELRNSIVIVNDKTIFGNPFEWNEREHGQIEVNPTFVQINDETGNIVRKTGNLLDDKLEFRKDTKIKIYFNSELSGSPIRQIQTPYYDQENKIHGYLIVAVPLEESALVLKNLRQALLISFPAILIILFLITRIIAGKSIAPIHNVINTAQKISKENIAERISLPAHKDEIYALTSTINGLLNRLEDALLREIQFTSDASHELRTPLSVIKGTLEVLVRKPREVPQYEEKINYCISETDRMTRLIDQLLMLARYDTGKIDSVKVEFSLTETLDAVLQRLYPMLHDKNIIINRNEDENFRLTADPSMIEIIFENILTNAIKYSLENKQIDIRIWKEDGRIISSLRDHGIGMTEPQIKNIFDRFYRTDESRNSEAGGFGLGLAICKKLCDLQNIDVKVVSAPGKGTNFLLHFPSLS
ncbi:MAG TPA: ATP-binding protein [Ignavibacteriaceae bacterium]|nr:ATP-binding protein [Ignavibacteriaceae bacterium]